MLYLALRFLPILCAFSLLLSPCTHASQQSSSSRQIIALEKELTDTKTKLEKVQKKLKTARNHLKLTRKQQEQAQRNIITDTSELATRRAKLVDIRLDRYVSKVDRLESRGNELQSRIFDYNKKLQRLLKAEKKYSAAPIKQKSKEKKRDIVAKAPPKKPTDNKAIVAVNQKTPVKKQKAAKKTTVSVSWPSLKSARAQDIVYAKTLIEKLTRVKANGVRLDEPLDEVKIINKHSFGTSEMEYLGGNLYSLVTKLKPGKQTFKIFNNTFWHVIPDTERVEQYRMIYDITSVSRPQFFVFSEALIK